MDIALHHGRRLEAAAAAAHHGAAVRAALHRFVGERVPAVVEIEHAAVVSQNQSKRMRGPGDGARRVHLPAAQVRDLVLQYVVALGCERLRIDRDSVHRYLRIRLLRRRARVLITLCGPCLRAALRICRRLRRSRGRECLGRLLQVQRGAIAASRIHQRSIQRHRRRRPGLHGGRAAVLHFVRILRRRREGRERKRRRQS